MKPAPTPIQVSLPALPRGWWVIRYAILADGRLAMLGADRNLRREWGRKGRNVPPDHREKVAAKTTARFWIFDGERLEEGPSFPWLTPFGLCFDRFPDGRWLVAGMRMENAGDEGRILTPEGQEVRRICLGNDIEHIKIDARGHIWVGWGDIGVLFCSNAEWRVPGLDHPPSDVGLAAFDETGNLVVLAPESAVVEHCYSLNICEETAWTCSWTGFPILACQVDKAARQWTTDIEGPGAIAVALPHILAVGGYGVEWNRAALLHLSGEQATQIAEWYLPFAGKPWSRFGFLDGRGDKIHIVQDGVWYRWAVEDFVRASARED